jgi:methyl-accepting chemotaxis protein
VAAASEEASAKLQSVSSAREELTSSVCISDVVELINTIAAQTNLLRST